MHYILRCISSSGSFPVFHSPLFAASVYVLIALHCVHDNSCVICPKKGGGRVCKYMHARAIRNALTQGRTVQKCGSNPPDLPANHTLPLRICPSPLRPVIYGGILSTASAKSRYISIYSTFIQLFIHLFKKF